MPPAPKSADYFIAKYWASIDQDENGCWRWKAYIRPNGYAQLYIGGGRGAPNSKVYVHRFAYELMVGPIPEGLDIDHLCAVRDCSNPGHLEPVTHRENMLRGNTFAAHNAAKTHCPKGHALIDEYEPNKRRCLECHVRKIPYGERTHCKRGHPFDEINTYLFPDGSGRGCRTCRRKTSKRAQERRRARRAA